MAVILDIDIEKPKDCKECPFMGTDGIGTLSPMMCIAIWGRSHEVKHCIKGKIHDDCPLKEVSSGKWISVNERLPEPYMFVNATCRSLVDDRENWVVETIYLPIPKEHNPGHYSDWGNIPMLNWGEAEVIAWMERVIPEPYKMVK